jgi:hypothetical protein
MRSSRLCVGVISASTLLISAQAGSLRAQGLCTLENPGACIPATPAALREVLLDPQTLNEILRRLASGASGLDRLGTLELRF